MQYWCSAATIDSSLAQKLEKSGLKSIMHTQADINPKDVLLIYSTPDQFLEKKRLEEGTAITSHEVFRIYEETSNLSKRYGAISSNWRLNLLDITSISRLCNGEHPQLDRSNGFPEIKPLTGLISLEILKREPRIIDIYLDLELKSFLFGLEPDSNYMQRLQTVSLADLVLMDWWEVNLDREANFEEVKNTMKQLSQIQTNYENLTIDVDRLRTSLRKQKSNYKILLDENKRLKESSSSPLRDNDSNDANQSIVNGKDRKALQNNESASNHANTPKEVGNAANLTQLPVLLAKKFVNFFVKKGI